MNPWWRRPAANEQPEPAPHGAVDNGTEDGPQPEAVEETEAADAAGTDEPVAGESGDATPTGAPASSSRTTAHETAAPPADVRTDAAAKGPDGSADEPAAEQAGGSSVSTVLEQATEPVEPSRPAAGDTSEPSRPRRRRRRRRSRRGGRGGATGEPDAAGGEHPSRDTDANRPARAQAGAVRVAALLDLGELIRSLHRDLAPDLEAVLARLDDEQGKLVLRRVYVAAREQGVDREALHRAGAEVVDVPPAPDGRDRSATVQIVVDALELCYTKRGVGAVVLAASSPQILPLVAKLQQNGLAVVGLGGPEGDVQVRAQCDRFIDLSG